jgi:tRNA U34 5-carboxymethylaminomethyl modifying enzyme MnmG/GidA
MIYYNLEYDIVEKAWLSGTFECKSVEDLFVEITNRLYKGMLLDEI